MEKTISCPGCGLEVSWGEKACPRCNAILPAGSSTEDVPEYPSLDENSGRVRQADSGQTNR